VLQKTQPFFKDQVSGPSQPKVSEFQLSESLDLLKAMATLANLATSSTHQKLAIFGEFKYSPKWPFFGNVPDSPTFASLVCSDSPDSLTFANLV
jgi:hypothetical protein